MWLFPHMTKVTCLHSHNFMKKLQKSKKLEKDVDSYKPSNTMNKLSIRQHAPRIENPAKKNPSHSSTNRKVSIIE